MVGMRMRVWVRLRVRVRDTSEPCALTRLFLDLPRDQQQSVAAQSGVAVDELVRRLEDLARLH